MNAPTALAYRACPLCEAICGLRLGHEQGHLLSVRGDPDDPFSRGHVCPKAVALIDLEQDPDRLRQPLRRDGDRWHAIGWEEAFTLAADRLHAVQNAYGADAVAAYAGNPNVHHFGSIAYLPGLLRLLGSRNLFSASSVDQWPHQLVCSLMYGHQFLLPIPDIDQTDYFLMLGANPLASNGSLFTAPGIGERLRALTARGKLVLIDPRRSETATVASEHLFIRPGEDVWFLLAFVQRLMQRSPPRSEAYAGRLRGLDSALAAIGAIPLDDLANRTGIAPATVERLADEFLAAPRAVAYGRMGLSTQRHGSLCQWLLQLINLYSGNLDRVGGCLPNEPVLPITGPGTSPGARGRWHSRVRGLPEFAGELPVAALAEEIATPGPGQIRALITIAGNPVLSTPDGAALDALLPTLDFRLAIDIHINETTRHADLILPPASPLTQYHYDSVFNAFAVRRIARLNLPLRERDADERADWEIINGLGTALSERRGRSWTALPPPLPLIAAGLARGGSGIGVDQLLQAPHGLDLGPLQPSLLRRLQTPDGCIDCAPAPLLEALREFGHAQTAAASAAGLRLIGRRHVRSNNSWMHNSERLVKGKPRHHAWVHPQDLRAAGIADGERARLRSARGVIEVDVMASEDVMPGVVSLPHGFGHALPGVRLARACSLPGANYNALSDPEWLDTVSGNAALNGIPVWLERAQAPAP